MYVFFPYLLYKTCPRNKKYENKHIERHIYHIYKLILLLCFFQLFHLILYQKTQKNGFATTSLLAFI